MTAMARLDTANVTEPPVSATIETRKMSTREKVRILPDHGTTLAG
jgi:hypothetical protein